MKLPVIKRINKGEVNSPLWFDPILSILNTFMERVVLCLTKRFTFRDNLMCDIKSIDFVHGVEQQVSMFYSTYSGCFLLTYPSDSSSDTVVTGFKARITEANVLAVTVTFAGAGTTTGTCNILILG